MTPLELETQLAELVAPLVGVPAADIDPEAYLDELGLSSRDAVVLAGELEVLLAKPVAPTIAWEAPTVRLLAELLLPTAADAGRPASLHLVRDEPEVEVDDTDPADDADRIAVIAFGCRREPLRSPGRRSDAAGRRRRPARNPVSGKAPGLRLAELRPDPDRPEGFR